MKVVSYKFPLQPRIKCICIFLNDFFFSAVKLNEKYALFRQIFIFFSNISSKDVIVYIVETILLLCYQNNLIENLRYIGYLLQHCNN